MTMQDRCAMTGKVREDGSQGNVRFPPIAGVRKGEHLCCMSARPGTPGSRLAAAEAGP
jgi:hypothetical protein